MGGDVEDTQIQAVGDLLQALEARRGSSYLIVLSGRSVGQMIPLEVGDTLIGRGKECDVVLVDRGVSRVHLRLSQSATGTVSVLDMGSTNGTWIEGERVQYQELRDGDRIRVGGALLLKLAYDRGSETDFAKHLFESATRDGLTQVHSGRVLCERLGEELLWHRRHGEPLAIAMVGVDDLQGIRDEWGRRAGDQVLRKVAAFCKGQLRGEDVLARYRDPVFALLLRRTDLDGARVVAERIRQRIAVSELTVGPATDALHLRVTVSVGLLRVVPEDVAPSVLLDLAEERLFRAQGRGRAQLEDGGA
ncbi:MAG: diguanylate cyclase [Deltaproteobacteria bacterium]|nr:diguanylate cyclase [Deltaproteobacteria bacterium]